MLKLVSLIFSLQYSSNFLAFTDRREVSSTHSVDNLLCNPCPTTQYSFCNMLLWFDVTDPLLAVNCATCWKGQGFFQLRLASLFWWVMRDSKATTWRLSHVSGKSCLTVSLESACLVCVRELSFSITSEQREEQAASPQRLWCVSKDQNVYGSIDMTGALCKISPMF